MIDLTKDEIEAIGEIKIDEDYKMRDVMEITRSYKDKTKFINITRLAEIIDIKKHNINRRQELNKLKGRGENSLVFVTKGAGGKMLVHPVLLPTVLMAIGDEKLYFKYNTLFLKALIKKGSIE